MFDLVEAAGSVAQIPVLLNRCTEFIQTSHRTCHGLVHIAEKEITLIDLKIDGHFKFKNHIFCTFLKSLTLGNGGHFKSKILIIASYSTDYNQAL